MDKLDGDKLERLLDSEAEPAVTVYIPMHTSASPPHISENQIRFKNLIHRAVEELPPHGQGRQLANNLDELLKDRLDDLSFWEDQTPGLLICASPEGISMSNLPIDTEEYLAIDRHYHLAPVLGLLHDAHDFYLLALAQHNPKLYRGSLYGLEPASVRLPANAETALNIDELNQKLENQGTATGPSSQGNATQPGIGRGWFNGRGGTRNTEAEERLRYLRILDHMVNEAADRGRPLILAGTEEEIATFRSVSRYPRLLETSIPGNHTADDNRSLFDMARTIVWRELIRPEHQAATEEYERLSGTNSGRVANNDQSIARAAEEGRIDKLLTRMISSTTDTVRDRLEELPRLTFPSAPESKRLNDVALTVWRSSGTIYNLLPDEMPEQGLMIARLRY